VGWGYVEPHRSGQTLARKQILRDHLSGGSTFLLIAESLYNSLCRWGLYHLFVLIRKDAYSHQHLEVAGNHYTVSSAYAPLNGLYFGV